MAQQPICDECKRPIPELGWRAYPARVEGGALVGSIEDEGGMRPIGDPRDLCTECGPCNHPLDPAMAVESEGE
jgi:hypothetical protein